MMVSILGNGFREKSVVCRVGTFVTSLVRHAAAGHAVLVGTTGENERPAGCPYASRRHAQVLSQARYIPAEATDD
jgi:hypothetical protein